MTSAVPPSPSPISVPTSQAWDSDGAGLWSTFIVEIGTPSQPSRVMISTAGNEVWVVAPAGCPDKYGSSCAKDRGGIFDPDNSTTWTNIGLFMLQLETNLGYAGNGQYGHETVSLGYPGGGGPSLDNQNVAGIAAPDYWQGIFGIDPEPSNFTTLNNPQPSFLTTLRNQSRIPSISWGYTAGAAYRYSKVQASLTLGGYDASRFSSANLTLPFYDDVARRFLVQLSTIKYIPTGLSTTTTPVTLMSDPISVYFDSTIPYIYLPSHICTKFETAFGLNWDNAIEVYLINDTMHTSLQSLNPNITFTLSGTSGQALDIVLPYKTFDLTASFPVIQNGTVNYFPLKRAANNTQYTLGRTFLQEAYLIADYDRSEFTIAPCVWPPTFTPDIKAILLPSANTMNTTAEVTVTHKHSTLYGAIAGGIFGLALLVGSFLLFNFLIYRRRHPKSTSEDSDNPQSEDSNSETAIDTTECRTDAEVPNVELVGQHGGAELYGQLGGCELDAKRELERKKAEIAGTPILGSELVSPESVGSELDTPQIHEMPAREVVESELRTPVSHYSWRSPVEKASRDYFDKDE